MESLHDTRVEQDHRDAQHKRGAHHPTTLPDLLAYDDDKPNRPKPAKPTLQQDARQPNNPS